MTDSQSQKKREHDGYCDRALHEVGDFCIDRVGFGGRHANEGEPTESRIVVGPLCVVKSRGDCGTCLRMGAVHHTVLAGNGCHCDPIALLRKVDDSHDLAVSDIAPVVKLRRIEIDEDRTVPVQQHNLGLMHF